VNPSAAALPEVVDYIVVGGGSSGCVVAGELSADPGVQVALIESGERAEAHPETLSADGYKTAFINDALLHDRFSEPQPHAKGQRWYLGTGRGFGGSGSINGMVYTRGAREDYATWPRGWQYDDLVPAFAAVERKLRVRQRAPTEFTETFVRAAEEAGFRRSEDMNDGDLSGVIGYETMNYEGAARRSSYVAYVADAKGRTNLHLVPRTRVTRVLIEAGRAVGVELVCDGRTRTLRARSEVVLCAGALESPKLLMLSGVGEGAALRRLGLPVHADLPELGHNLHDHPNVAMFFAGNKPVDAFYPQLYAFHRANPQSDLPQGQSDTCYVMYPARSSFREAMMRMLPTKLPLQLYGERSKATIRALVAAGTALGPVERFIERMWGCVVILGKPKSRGRISLSSASPTAQALIDPGYFSDPEDMETMLKGVRLGQRIARAAPLRGFGNAAILPFAFMDSDAAIREFIALNAMTTFHFAGTCRMGEDPKAVVDTALRVRGVSGLRVADASVAPFTPVSAMNAPSMMIGKRAADLMREARAEAQASGCESRV
jgi:choline dehydrogenase